MYTCGCCWCCCCSGSLCGCCCYRYCCGIVAAAARVKRRTTAITTAVHVYPNCTCFCCWCCCCCGSGKANIAATAGVVGREKSCRKTSRNWGAFTCVFYKRNRTFYIRTFSVFLIFSIFTYTSWGPREVCCTRGCGFLRATVMASSLFYISAAAAEFFLLQGVVWTATRRRVPQKEMDIFFSIRAMIRADIAYI